ncbi:MAG: endonuclease/exonuclease/phosphatase family protein [Ignavibacteria bacterium]|nr:endonuclease/exonuclease/phosphatase family protein [Ignavibacteria bacterium]
MKQPNIRLRIIAVIVLTLLSTSGNAQQRPGIDGRFEDWEAVTVNFADKSGDGGSTGIDFRSLKISNDEDFLYLSLDVGNEIGLQEKNGVKLYIDTDANPATGTRFHGVGAELIWSFGERKGTIWNGTGPVAIKPAAFGLVTAPTVSSDRFEMALSRNAVIGVITVFPETRIRLLFAEAGGDQLPDGDAFAEYTFSASPFPPVPTRAISKPDPAALRILTWNVLFNGPFDAAREPSFRRILKALKPDILCFQEMFDVQPEQVRSYIESILPLTDGRQWHASKTDTGNVLVSSWPIEHARQVQPVYRESAHLVQPGAPWTTPLLLINNHLRCCTANAERQAEVDGLIAFIRDARAGAGPLSLVTGTPILLAGDFNFVGHKQQLTSLLTGDIIDNGLYGPDSSPDWNGGPLLDLSSRRLNSLFTWTWGDRTSAYAAGKLDYVFHTPSVLRIVSDMVFDTRDMSVDARTQAGLLAGDSETASDHCPTVVDCLPGNVNSVAESAEGQDPLQLGLSPNPAADQSELRYFATTAGRASITITDAIGRRIMTAERDVDAPGMQRHPLSLRGLTPGSYFLQVAIGGLVKTVRFQKATEQ